ncbi:RE1 [Symbiodinium sp. CCMP2592]|nr:RE1 [Symbiodinium sp. CCMP2592]
MLARLDAQSPLANDALFDQALLLAFQAKNALMRHRGYAPEQIVLGKSLRVPGSLTSDEDLTSHALVEGSDLEAELHRQRLDVRCRARQVFWEADNSQTIRRALLRRSNPVRGPYKPGDWVLYWMRKGSPNRLAAGRWHGPARVISQEGQSITWISHGSIILRCAPENLRPASLREWQQLSTADFSDPHKNAGGASSFVDLTGNESSAPVTNAPAPASSSGDLLVPLPTPVPSVSNPATNPIPDDDLIQPEQELTPQVSGNPDPPTDNREVEREVERQPDHAAPSIVLNDNPNASVTPADPLPSDVPVPDSDEGLLTEAMACTLVPEELPEESVLLSTEACDGDLHTFTTVLSGTSACGPPLAEDNLPYVEQPLQCSEQQAFCLEIPMKAKDLRRWAQERAPEQLSYLATVGKRARAEVHVKDLSAAELQLFNQAKQKEIQCWIQTSAIKSVLRQRLNPEQILRSRWILTWKNPEPGDTQRKAKARLVVLGYQDPKLVDVSRDAPTLSKEGRALVLQTIASKRFELSSFDIKTAFLRGKADENNPLAMDPPKELREALQLKDNEVCQLLGNAYGRVDAPLLFYKELSKQLLELGFVRHPLEPCVFLLYTGSVLNGILGVHVDDGVCGGDAVFSQKIQSLQTKLPFGSRKHRNFVFTGIHLEQFPDFSIRASQGEYVKNIPQLDIGRARRMQPAAPVTENERSRLRGIIGSLQYAVTHTRPDMAAKLGELQTQVTTATVQTLLLANKVLRETQEQADAYAMSKAVDMLGWMRALWGVVHVPEFRWQSPEESYKKLKKAIIVTDCKSLFDLVTRLAMPACEEHRTTLEVLLIKQRCSENASFRWIPTTLQAADCLTKAMDATLLRTVLAQGRFKLYDTTQALEKDAQRKQAIAWLSQPDLPLDMYISIALWPKDQRLSNKDKDTMRILLFQEDYVAVGLEIDVQAAPSSESCTLVLSETSFPDVVRFHRGAEFVQLCLSPDPDQETADSQECFDWDWPEEDAEVWTERISGSLQELLGGDGKESQLAAQCLAEWAETRCDARPALATVLSANLEFSVFLQATCQEACTSPAALAVAYPLAMCLKFASAAPGASQARLVRMMQTALETFELPVLLAHTFSDSLASIGVMREASRCTDASTTDTEGLPDELSG